MLRSEGARAPMLALSGNLSMEYAPSVGREGGEVPNFTARFLRLIEQARP